MADTPGCARAGWSLVIIDEVGNVVRAAFGALPADVAPLQRAKGAEDFAVFMSVQLARQPYRLWVDCASTLASGKRGKAWACRSAGLTAHMWSVIFAAHPEGVDMRKTKAHTSKLDVERGITTHWQRGGNEEADRLAKKGPLAAQPVRSSRPISRPFRATSA